MNRIRHIPRFPLLYIITVLILAYLPATSFIYAVKNDLLTSYFPAKFFLSESLRSGEFPLWNPFINYGLPTSGDLSLSYWNPLTWIISAKGYDVYTITLELMLYILLAGVGMYTLTGIWISNKDLRLSAALLYMCSGFMTGHLQHLNWINAAGLLPFCIYAYWQLLTITTPKSFLACLFFLSFFCTAVHPGHIIGLIYLLTGLTIFHGSQKGNRKKTTLTCLGMMLSLALILSGPIFGYLQVLPHTNRFGPVNADTVLGVTDPGSWLSFIFPLSITSDTWFLANDIALRNCYIGLLPMSMLPLLAGKKDRRIALFFFSAGFIFLILCTSMAGYTYERLPLINHVRLPGEFRLFALCALILAGFIQFGREREKAARIMNAFSLFILLAVITSCICILTDHATTILKDWPSKSYGMNAFLRSFVHQLTFADKIIIQGILQFVIAQMYVRRLRNTTNIMFSTIVVLECLVTTLPNLPFTGVGMRSPAEIQNVISLSPKSIQRPYTEPESTVVNRYPDTDALINNWGFYSKQAATKDLMSYPMILNGSSAYFKSGEHDTLYDHPFAFLNGPGKVVPVSRSYHTYTFLVDAEQEDTITIKQVHFKGWKGFVNGKSTSVSESRISLSGIPVAAGRQTVEFRYEAPLIKWFLIIHLLAMLLLVCTMLVYRIRYIFP